MHGVPEQGMATGDRLPMAAQDLNSKMLRCCSRACVSSSRKGRHRLSDMDTKASKIHGLSLCEPLFYASVEVAQLISFQSGVSLVSHKGCLPAFYNLAYDKRTSCGLYSNV